MYNGIGLRTPRGSGTSGYVEKSRVAVHRVTEAHVEKKKRPSMTSKALQDYDKRRKVELECYILRKKLTEKQTDESEIQKALDDLRAQLQEKPTNESPPKKND